ALEIFVDPQRFHGTCYKAAGWQQLGATQGSERSGQDFYTDTEHPKELWVRPLSPTALEQLRAPELPPALADPKGPLPPVCPGAPKRDCQAAPFGITMNARGSPLELQQHTTSPPGH
ncbi:MAG: hypothetical protein ABSH34_20955, partial [Verrucomicrobiota bacterium]